MCVLRESGGFIEGFCVCEVGIIISITWRRRGNYVGVGILCFERTFVRFRACESELGSGRSVEFRFFCFVRVSLVVYRDGLYFEL